MAEFAAAAVAPVADSGVKCVAVVIKRQLNYLCCFNSNITALNDEATKLDRATQGVQAKVDAAKNNLQEIDPEVTSWCGTSDNFKTEMNTILQVPNVETGCLRVVPRYSQSRRAKKTAEAMAQHREKCRLFVDVSLPPLAAACRPTPLGTTYEFDSRKKIEQDIMTALRDGHEKIIGICGMGGLGKTTMAKRIMNRSLEEHLFQEVVMAVVSQPVDKLKLQVEIAGSLGLKGLENEPAQARVQKLYERLTSGTKRILLVLDDVWENLNLNELGIPCEGISKRCTILITSRNGDTLRKMNVKKVLGMESLSEEDAWFLFREKAGTCVDDRKLKPTAKKVVEKCRGLPIALITVGMALNDEKSMSVWKDALKQLRKANPKNTPSFIAEVYNPLILSYDRLDFEEAKSLFLVCCLYSEDENIPIEELTYFCMGLRTFTDMRSLEEVRNRICTLIKSLKSRSLLLDGDRKYCVRMHDVVRDVCIFIAKQKRYIGGNDCTWISSVQLPGEGTELHTELGFPNLRLLHSRRNKIKIDNVLLESMTELCVLSIPNYSWTSLPHTTQSLCNLRTLVLDSCEDLETISVVGKLINLEILICRQCYIIVELPQEIGGLMHLKLLDLTGCVGLQSIAPGIISSLVGLEELKMIGSFKKWEAEDGERQNAGLRELESLTKLTCLEIQIADPALAAQQINLSSKMERFDITIGEDFYSGWFNKKIALNWKEKICLGHWIEKLVNDTECLYFSGNGTNNFDLTRIQNIKELKLRNCDGMKNIGTTSMDDDGDAILFPHMEILNLSYLPHIQEIWNGPISSHAFQNLKKIQLEDLPVLKQLWTTSTSMDDDGGATLLPRMEFLTLENLPQLQEICNGLIPSNSFQNLKEIELSNLPVLKQLWTTSMDDDGGVTLLPNMERLELSNLPQLQEIWNGPIRSNSFQNLNELRLLHLPVLKQLWTTSMDDYGGAIFLPHMKRLILSHLPQLQSMLQLRNSNTGLPQLQSLEIKYCEMMEQVIMCREGRNEFPLLSRLLIWKCPKLRNIIATTSLNAENDDHSSHLFCQPHNVSFGSLEVLAMERKNPFCRHNRIHLPFVSKLEELYIRNCRGSTSLFMPSIAKNLVNLRELTIDNCHEMVEVIEDDNEDQAVSGGERCRLFPNLQTLELSELPKLEMFCKWKRDVELPSLTKLNVKECPNMARFTLGSTTTPQYFTVFKLGDTAYNIDVATDLNSALQKHYAKQKEIEST